MRKLLVTAVAAVAVALGLWSALAANAATAPSHGRSTVRVSVPQQATVPQQAAVPDEATGETESGTGTETGTESGTESGSGTEADAHEDPNGQDVQHECPPSCDTANGEQP